VDVDHGQLVGRRLKDCPVGVRLHELLQVGQHATGRRDWWRLERFAEVRQGLTLHERSHPGLLPLANLRFEVSRLLPAVSSESDVAATPRARKRKLLAHPCHQFGRGYPRGVMGAGLVTRIAAAIGISACRMSADRMPTSRGIGPLAVIPDGECRDGGPDL
jgi:hypothetical protein